MIKLSENRVGLINLDLAIQALDDIDELIRIYSENKAGPAYVKFQYDGNEKDVQFARKTIVVALKSQRQVLVDYFENLGIQVD